ncbi:helix-turn-helix transcriptional regulator [Nocardioides sp. NPDC126508]
MSESRTERDAVLAPFGARLRELRKARGMTQTELSEVTGLNRITISKIERGLEDIGIVRLTRLAASLEVTVADLLNG